MPRHLNEREAMEKELAQLPAQIANHQRQLDATATRFKTKRERLWLLVRRDQMRNSLSFVEGERAG